MNYFIYFTSVRFKSITVFFFHAHMHLEYHSKDNYKSKHISHETGLLLWIKNNWSYDNHKAATLEESTNKAWSLSDNFRFE